jgi:predicted nuclease of predicted toxin-antitoxin system
MPVTVVLDQGVPRDAAGRLRDLGYECVHVGEVGMSAADDEEVLRFAHEKNGIVVTLDADFHAILAVSGAEGPSVIRIRIQGLRAAEIVECVQSVSTRFDSELKAGSLVTIKKQKTTCHRLPIGRSHETAE